jgi:uncharacterized protein (TIGR02996 family)
VTDTGSQLLQSILDTPADDTVRLVYADYLSEQDDEYSHLHAELIRLQVELNAEDAAYVLDGRMNPKVYAGSSDARVRRCSELARRMYLEDFTDSVHRHPRLCHVLGTGSWRRGFMQTLRCSPGQWLVTGDFALKRHPLERVELEYLPRMTATRRQSYPDPMHRQHVTEFTVEWESLRATVVARVSDRELQLHRSDRGRWDDFVWINDTGWKLAMSSWWPRLRPEQWEVRR